MFRLLESNYRNKITFAACSVAGFDTCWIWRGKLNSNGYAQIASGALRNKMVHRVVYERLVGAIPTGLTLDHLCRVRNCVNPAHLEPVTLQENLRRGFGVGVINAAKTQCGRGHDLSDGNYYLYGGKRFCKKCQRIRQAAADAKTSRSAA